MNQKANQTEAAASARALKMKWVIVGVMLLLAAALIVAMPRGYKDDLSLIGKGTPIVVLVHDKNSMRSLDLMHAADGLRAEYAGKIDFLVADLNSEQGRQFLAANNVTPPALVLFDQNGAQLKILDETYNSDSLRKELNKTFNLSTP